MRERVFAGWQVNALGAILFAAAVLYLLSLRSGQPWDDDFALYVLHARNIAEGRPYEATGFVYNAGNPLHSPSVYPPAFPLLLAPFYAVYGINLEALRVVVVISLLGAVAAFAFLARPALPPQAALAVTAAVAFQPYFVRFKDLLLPDLTFLLFTLLTLWLFRRIHEADRTTSRQLLFGLLAGVCMYVAISLRIVGLALPLAVIGYHVLRLRLPTLPIVIAGLVALSLHLVQVALMPAAPGYAAQAMDAASATSSSTSAVWWYRLRRAVDLFAATDVLWASRGELRAPEAGGVGRMFTLLLMVTTGGLALLGYGLRLTKLSVVETFAVVYAVGVAVRGGPNARYLIPLLPLLFYYAAVGALYLSRRGRVLRAAMVAVTALIAVNYAVNLARLDRRPFSNGVTSVESSELFEFVRRCIPPEARLASHRPRALALYTERSATSVGSRQLEASRFTRFMETSEIDFVVTSRNAPLNRMAQELPDVLVPLFQNRRFRVLRVDRGVEGARPLCAGPAETVSWSD